MGCGASNIGRTREQYDTRIGRPQTDPERGYNFTSSNDTPDELESQLEFLDTGIRNQFVRKVYFILVVQLLITITIVLIFKFNFTLCMLLLKNFYIWWVCVGFTTIFLCLLFWCETLRRKFPVNVIILGLFTVLEGCIFGGLTCLMKNDILLMAVGITAAVCLGVSIFALQTKWDITMWGGFLFVLLIILLVMGIIAIFVYNRILHLVYSVIGTTTFCIHLMYDTQLMLGGKHRFEIDPDEHIFAALHLYIDVVMIFTYLTNFMRY